MQNNKSVEKKLKITILSLCIALVALVGAVIGIWAATSQVLKTSFTISYDVGDNVAARVKTEYYVPNQDADEDGVEDGTITVVKNKNGQEVEHTNGYVVFNTIEDNRTEELYMGDFRLTPQSPKVIFYFTIQNLLYEDYIQTIFSTDFASKENVKYKMYYYNAKSFPYSSASEIADEDWTLIPYNNVEAQGYKCIKMEISVVDANAKARCSGDNLLQLYHSTEAQNVSTLNKTAFQSLTDDSTESIIFDYAQNKISYPTTGTDLSVEGDGSIWGYTSGATTYVISRNTILFPQDSSNMFSSLYSLTNLKLSNVNTLNVTNMSGMFDGCSALTTLDLSSFNTSNVTDMSSMFAWMPGFWAGGTTIEIDLSSFNTSKVTDMSSMFAYSDLIVDVSGFDTSSVTDMSSMFLSDGPAARYTGITNFDTSNVTDMSDMFRGQCYFSQEDIVNFNTSNVTDMSGMFSGIYNTGHLDLSHFDTSKVTDMSHMFDGSSMGRCSISSLDISTWDTSKVTDMSGMFYDNYTITSIYVGSGWNTDAVTSSADMFYESTNLPNFNRSYTDKTRAYAGGQGYLTLK